MRSPDDPIRTLGDEIGRIVGAEVRPERSGGVVSRIRAWNRERLARRRALRLLPRLLALLAARDGAPLRALMAAGSEAGPVAPAPVEAAPRRVPPAPGESKNEWYDGLTIEVMDRVLGAGSVCVDVGCNRGEVLRLMMARAPRGTFYAFEPLPDHFEALTATFREPGVKLYNLALSERAGEASFNHVVSNPAYSGFKRRRYDRPNEVDTQITVRTERLDAIVPPSERVAFVKIDVEGAELQVLRGAVETIRRSRPVIVFEHGLGAADFYGTDPGEVFDLLVDECGLRVSQLDQWLDGRPAFERQEFRDDFLNGRNYYYMAYPPLAEDPRGAPATGDRRSAPSVS